MALQTRSSCRQCGSASRRHAKAVKVALDGLCRCVCLRSGLRRRAAPERRRACIAIGRTSAGASPICRANDRRWHTACHRRRRGSSQRCCPIANTGGGITRSVRSATRALRSRCDNSNLLSVRTLVGITVIRRDRKSLTTDGPRFGRHGPSLGRSHQIAGEIRDGALQPGSERSIQIRDASHKPLPTIRLIMESNA
jgi:hypothetical protein